jgi:hypothetical protein
MSPPISIRWRVLKGNRMSREAMWISNDRLFKELHQGRREETSVDGYQNVWEVRLEVFILVYLISIIDPT